ncbi:nuclear transport factor 2 family protein [Rhodococcus sp. NPDC003318]|uniref:nuclear transport factor 2 family protein n=1 Tax=Rhodococcus sp. NPDC003318 TaxID=3364503 RepID=UPI0036872B18
MRAWFAAGAATALVGRRLVLELLLRRFRASLAALDAGDHRPLLASYRQDAVLHFADGNHRWAGDHEGREAIERFLRDFVAAGLHGEIGEAYFGGPPWRMTVLARFDDRAEDPDGTEIYRNRTVLLLRTKWGKVVEQEDYYEDTSRIERLDAHLRDRDRP